jgi:hypothetical protein
MVYLPSEALATYRRNSFHLLSSSRLNSKEDAIQFVNERGFVYFWPIKDILFPSLWTAVAGNRQVADAHDDPGHITWGWKDSLLGKKVWYYGKVLRRKATIISLDIAPYFYALSENYGSPEEDYLTLYEQGRLTVEAKMVYEALLTEGILDTIALRKAARMTSSESNSRFERALADLQSDFKILPVGITDSGAWKYAFAYDIVARHFPELPEKAQLIREKDARLELLKLYFQSVGAASIPDVSKLFGWRLADINSALAALNQAGFLCSEVEIENQKGAYFVIKHLVDPNNQ